MSVLMWCKLSLIYLLLESLHVSWVTQLLQVDHLALWCYFLKPELVWRVSSLQGLVHTWETLGNFWVQKLIFTHNQPSVLLRRLEFEGLQQVLISWQQLCVLLLALFNDLPGRAYRAGKLAIPFLNLQQAFPAVGVWASFQDFRVKLV